MAAPSGTTWGSTVGSYGRIGIYVDVLSDTDTQLKYEVEVWFWSKYSVSDSNNTLYYDHKTSSGSASTSRGSKSISTTVNSGNGWSTSNQKRLATYGPYTINRTTSSQKRYMYAKLKSVDAVGGTMYASKTYTIAAKTSYAVIYNANGGTGAPANQTKWHGDNLTLSTTVPTRTGYTFQGWGSSADDTTPINQPGGTYTDNGPYTYYAIWKINTWTVSYNANGGTGAPANQTKTYGVTLTLSSTKPTRTNYNFKGWATSASSTTVVYNAGGSYTANAAATLYAVWELAYKKPRISGLSVIRCLKDGTPDDEGTNTLVKFTWATDYNVTDITFYWKISTSDAYLDLWTVDPGTGSLTGGTIETIVGENASYVFETDHTYDFMVQISDSNGSSSKTITLAGTIFVIDMLGGGKGVSFGKPAELEGVAEFGFDAKFNKPVYGKALGMDKVPSIPDNSELDDYNDPGCYAVYTNAAASTITSRGALLGSDGVTPPAKAGRLEVWAATGSGVHPEDYSYLRQRFIPYDTWNAVWEREMSRSPDNVWTYYDWRRTTLTPAASKKVYHEPVVLASCESYMHNGQSITLPQAISAQPNGIVLAFSYYEPSGAGACDYNWHYFFVPKLHVSKHSNKGVDFHLIGHTGNSSGHKYLYITDTVITGHVNNSGETTAGTYYTFANNYWVLRYVIGV